MRARAVTPRRWRQLGPAQQLDGPAMGWRSLLLALAMASAITISGCGADDPSGSADSSAGALQGLVRPDPLDVAAVRLPEASSGSPVDVVPDPGSLEIVYFGYTSCPDVCPTTMADLQRAFDQLDPDERDRLSVAFVTVDPQRDSADLLDRYLGYFFDRYSALRTEDRAELEVAQDAFLASSSITPTGPDTYDVGHSAATYVVDHDGKVVVEWPFGTSSDVIADDLEILLAANPAV